MSAVLADFIEERDDLMAFLRWFMVNMTLLGRVPFDHAVHVVERVTSILLYRDKEFQVQMFATQPLTIIPEHLHPNVDSFEVYMGGQLRFSKHGRWTTEAEHQFVQVGTSAQNRAAGCIRVHPNDWHGGIAGPSGAAFMSVQHWLNGVEPSCVANDYIGAVMGEDHFRKVTTGTPELKAALSPRDAARFESQEWPAWVC